MRDHRGVSVLARQVNGIDGLADRADLVHFDKDRIANSGIDASLQPFNIRHEQVIAHELNLLAQFPSHELPAVPIVFGKTVFERHYRVLPRPASPELYHLFAGMLALVRLLENVTLFRWVVE